MDDKKIFTEAFNRGYLLRKYNPSLTRHLVTGLKNFNHPYVDGFANGVGTQEKEQTQKLNQFLENEKQRQKNIKISNKEHIKKKERD